MRSVTPEYLLVQKYLTPDRRDSPLPWHPTEFHTGTSTEHYALMLLNALAGDERRTELRRVFRLYKCHQKAGDNWKNATYYMLIEACWEFHDILPYSLLIEHLGHVNGSIYGHPRLSSQEVFTGVSRIPPALA